jgi:hypothetical protein
LADLPIVGAKSGVDRGTGGTDCGLFNCITVIQVEEKYFGKKSIHKKCVEAR